jgi:hypothetical protein
MEEEGGLMFCKSVGHAATQGEEVRDDASLSCCSSEVRIALFGSYKIECGINMRGRVG